MHFSAGVFLTGELKYSRKAALAIGVGSDGMSLLIEVFKINIPVLCLFHVKLPQASALLSSFSLASKSFSALLSGPAITLYLLGPSILLVNKSRNIHFIFLPL
jgi:hypothetical protein